MADFSRDLFAHYNRLSPAVQQGGASHAEGVVLRAAQCLTRSQSQQGSWGGIVRSTVRPTIEYLLLLTILDRSSSVSAIPSESPCAPTPDGLASEPPKAPDAVERHAAHSRQMCMSRAAVHIARQQQPNGFWNSSTRVADLDTSVLAYFALRLANHDAQADHMERARSAILGAGGVQACEPLTGYWCAVLGEQDYTACRPLPPEFGLLPSCLPGAIHGKHLLTRSVLTALALLSANQTVWSASDSGRLISELAVLQGSKNGTGSRTRRTNGALQKTVTNRFLKWWPRQQVSPLRRHATDVAESWLVKQIDDQQGGVLGDATATIWVTLALLACGRNETAPEVQSCLRFLESLQLTNGATTEMGLAKADLRGTALTCRALGVVGVSMNEAAMSRCVDWLLNHESQHATAKISATEMSGWSAHGSKKHYIDAETTAMVLLALREHFSDVRPQVASSEDSMVAIVRASSGTLARRNIALLDRMAAASRKSRHWLLGSQNADGGWGHFDGRQQKKRRPVAKHLAWSRDLLNRDVSSVITTSWVLESLARWDERRDSVIRRAVAYLKTAQEADGHWAADHSKQSLFATWRVVSSLLAAGTNSDDPAITNAVTWVMGEQHRCGAWCDRDSGAAVSTLAGGVLEPVSIVHTSWALLTLVDAGFATSSVARRAVEFLGQHQQSHGGWEQAAVAVGYRACMDCGLEPYAAQAYPLLAIASWMRVASS